MKKNRTKIMFQVFMTLLATWLMPAAMQAADNDNFTEALEGFTSTGEKQTVTGTFRILSEEQKTCELTGEVNGSTYNTAIVKMDLPSEVNGYKLVSITAKFTFVKELEEVTLPETVESIGGCFIQMQKLRKFTAAEGLKHIIGTTFYNCPVLSDLNLPSSVEDIGESSFYNCQSLRSFCLPKSCVTFNGRALDSCSNLDELTIEDGNTTFYSPAGSNVVMKQDGSDVILVCAANKCVLPDDFTVIGPHAFSTRTIDEIKLPHTLKNIDTSAFFGVRTKEITIPNSVTSLGRFAFQASTTLERVAFEEPCQLQSFAAGAFLNCTSLTDIVIPESISYIDESLFEGCKSLTKIRIPNVTKISSNAFKGCTALNEVVIDSRTHDLIIDNYAFSGCNSVKSLVFEHRYPWAIRPNDNFSRSTLENFVFPVSHYKIATGRFRYTPEALHPFILLSDDPNGTPYGSFDTNFALPADLKAYIAADYDKASNTVALEQVDAVYKEENEGHGTGVILKGEPGKRYEQFFILPNNRENPYKDRNLLTGNSNVRQMVTALSTYSDVVNFPFKGDRFEYTYAAETTGYDFQVECPDAYLTLPMNQVGAQNPVYIRGMESLKPLPLLPAERTDIVFGDFTEETDLDGQVIGWVYYALHGDDGYDAENHCLTLNSNMSEQTLADILNMVETGTAGFGMLYSGIVLYLPAGEGTVSIDAMTRGNYELKVKIGGDADAALTFKKNERGTIDVEYAVDEPTYCYIFGLEQEAGAKAKRVEASENSASIYAISIQPETTDVNAVEPAARQTGQCFDLQGRRINPTGNTRQPTLNKGIYIIDGKKTVIK